jgi:ABC-2 type transport system permease protein
VTRLVRVELLKLRTVRLPAGLLITAAGLTALFAAVEAWQAGRASSGIGSLASGPGLSAVTTVTGWALLLAAVLGVTVSSGEFRHGTATLTYLAAPSRVRVLAAKAIAAGCAGAVFGLAAGVIATGAGLAFTAGRGYRLAVGAGALAGHVAGAVVGAALLAALGAGLGSLVRSQLAGIVGVFVWGLVIESVLGGVFPSLHPYLPYTAATTLAGVKLGAGPGGFRVAVKTHSAAAVPVPLPFAAATALVAGVAFAVCVVAACTTVRRDVT